MKRTRAENRPTAAAVLFVVFGVLVSLQRQKYSFPDLCSKDCDFWERILSLNSHVSLCYLLFYSLFYIHVVVVVHQGNCWEEVEVHRQRPGSQMW